MPAPRLSLSDYEDRVLLEIWLLCEFDLDAVVAQDELSKQVRKHIAHVPSSWLDVAVKGLKRKNMLTLWHEDGSFDDHHKCFYLTENGLRWCDMNRNRFEGYSDTELQLRDLNDFLDDDVEQLKPDPQSQIAGDFYRLHVPQSQLPTGFVAHDAVITENLDDLVVTLTAQPLPEGKNDRIRHRNDDPEGWNSFASDMQAITEAVRGHNDYDAKDSEEVERIIKQFQAGSMLITADTVNVGILTRILKPALHWVLSKTGEGFFSQLGSRAVDALEWLSKNASS